MLTYIYLTSRKVTKLNYNPSNSDHVFTNKFEYPEPMTRFLYPPNNPIIHISTHHRVSMEFISFVSQLMLFDPTC